jgi:hypothetical protein
MAHFRLCTALIVALLVFAPKPPTRAQTVAEAPPELAIPATDEGLPGAGPIRRADWFQPIWNERRIRPKGHGKRRDEPAWNWE